MHRYIDKALKGVIRMKRCAALLLILMLLPLSALANMPAVPQGLHTVDIVFQKGQLLDVYSGPGESYARAGNGKARVSTNDWIQVYGMDPATLDTWLMIRYGVSGNKTRIGWIMLPVGAEYDDSEYLHWDLNWDGRSVLVQSTYTTDDPFGLGTSTGALNSGTKATLLMTVQDWAYIEVRTNEGLTRTFVPAHALTITGYDLSGHPAFTATADLLARAGIEAEITSLYGKEIIFAPTAGGTMRYYAFGSSFSPFEMSNWRIEGLSDTDMQKYLDVQLSLLSDMLEDKAAEEYLRSDYQGDLGARNIDATLSNALGALDNLGDQTLRILLHQLSLHDGRNTLNSLRSLLAYRILNYRDLSVVDPHAGCAWYDSLMIAKQDALPPVDAALYMEDPLLCAAAQYLIDHAPRDAYSARWDADSDKSCLLACLQNVQTTQSGSTVMLEATAHLAAFALYDGRHERMLHAVSAPIHMTLAQDNGTWTVKDARQTAAPTLLTFAGRDAYAALSLYLAANGYTVSLDPADL